MPNTMSFNSGSAELTKASSAISAADSLTSLPAETQLPRRWGAGLSQRMLLDLVKACDLGLLTLIAYVACFVRIPPVAAADRNLYITATAIGLILWVTMSRSTTIYQLVAQRPLTRLRAVVGSWFGVALWMLVLAFLLPGPKPHFLQWQFIWFVGGLIGLTLSHFVVVKKVSSLAHAGLLRDIVILGAGDLGCRVADHIRKSAACGLRMSGLFDDRSTRLPDSSHGEVRGNFSDALAFIRPRAIDSVIIALPLHADQRIMQLIRKVTQMPVDVYVATDALGFHLPSYAAPNLGGLPVILAAERPIKDWRAALKLIEDKLIAILAIACFAPLLVGIAILIKLDSRGPVLFRQPRCGFNENLFHVYKFRTMYVETTDLLGDRLVERGDKRVTRLGAFLRRTSLDELPQLFNVLLGSMSIVGPRPHPVNAKAANLLYSEVVALYASRHRVKPGITGWAQVNGWRGQTDTYEKIEKRVEHDLYYIEHWSVRFDLWILILTVFKGFYHKEAY